VTPKPGTCNWQMIAEQVTVERDSQRLLALLNQLCAALDEEAKRKQALIMSPMSEIACFDKQDTSELPAILHESPK
jgi:hypothetical protein